MTDQLAIAAIQANPVLGAIERNAEKARELIARAHAAGADLAVFSELFLIGYPPEDLALNPAAVRAGPRLSPRERDCIGLIAEGKSDWEIGEILGVAETTVITHVQSARRKLGARTRAHAVALCLLSGLI